MIKVSIKKENANYKKVTLNGHALYDDYGKDIVCSAASSIVTTTVNACLAFDKESLTYKVNEQGMEIDINNADKTTQVLIENMISLLKELETSYPKNIEIK